MTPKITTPEKKYIFIGSIQNGSKLEIWLLHNSRAQNLVICKAIKFCLRHNNDYFLNTAQEHQRCSAT